MINFLLKNKDRRIVEGLLRSSGQMVVVNKEKETNQRRQGERSSGIGGCNRLAGCPLRSRIPCLIYHRPRQRALRIVPFDANGSTTFRTLFLPIATLTARNSAHHD